MMLVMCAFPLCARPYISEVLAQSLGTSEMHGQLLLVQNSQNRLARDSRMLTILAGSHTRSGRRELSVVFEPTDDAIQRAEK